ncbi:MAG TPA: hypothetical protein VKA19_08775, partial [Alphaproteobacteria bacterium]|nr:hypothetical protein [Alphaproteobacteria bacterium]
GGRKLAGAFCLAAVMAVGSTGTAFAAVKMKDGHPDLSGFWSVKFERKPSGQALIDELPKGTTMIKDTGPGELKKGDYSGLQLTQRALDQAKNYHYKDDTTVQNNCKVPTIAFLMQAPFPMQIFQGRDMIVLKMEYFDMVRVVFMDGRGHEPAGAPHSNAGDSIGHWDGNTLVVDTTHLEAGTMMNNGFDHSEDMHVIEKFRLSPDGNTLWATQLYKDPKTFKGYAARYLAWTRKPGEYVYPYDCDPNYANE